MGACGSKFRRAVEVQSGDNETASKGMPVSQEEAVKTVTSKAEAVKGNAVEPRQEETVEEEPGVSS